jgi:LacI family transcriptional regulator
MGTSNRELVREIIDLGLPAVVADHTFEDLAVDCVDIDSEGGAAAAVGHLASLGHRRIGYLANTRPEYNPPRYRGYLRGLIEAGIEPDERLVFQGTPSTEGGYKLMRGLLDEGRELPTAYLAYGGTMAVGAMHALEERGLSVPGNVSLAGCGSRWFALANPGMTTAVAEAHLLGATAVRTLLERVENPKAEPQKVRLPMELRVAASTAAPHAEGRS